MPLRSLVMVLLPSLLCAATPQKEIAVQVPAARVILDGWQARDPVKADRKLHIVYWTPADRNPAPRHRERLSAVMRDVRKFYGSEMERLGFGFRTFTLDEAADGLLNIHVITGAQPYAHYDVPSGDEIRKECLPVLKNEHARIRWTGKKQNSDPYPAIIKPANSKSTSSTELASQGRRFDEAFKLDAVQLREQTGRPRAQAPPSPWRRWPRLPTCVRNSSACPSSGTFKKSHGQCQPGAAERFEMITASGMRASARRSCAEP